MKRTAMMRMTMSCDGDSNDGRSDDEEGAGYCDDDDDDDDDDAVTCGDVMM